METVEYFEKEFIEAVQNNVNHDSSIDKTGVLRRLKQGYTTNVYKDQPRIYHDINHIIECFTTLNDMYGKLNINYSDYKALLVAIAYHDIVYKVGEEGNNEIQSANYAIEELRAIGVNEVFIRKVSNLILQTDHFKPHDGSYLSAIIRDIDISLLASRYEDVINNNVNIMTEVGPFYFDTEGENAFSKVNKDAIDFFQYMLDKDRIFITDAFYNKFERKIRDKLNQIKYDAEKFLENSNNS